MCFVMHSNACCSLSAATTSRARCDLGSVNCELCTMNCELCTARTARGVFGASGSPFGPLPGALVRDRKTVDQIHFIDTLGFARHTKYGTRHPPEKTGWRASGADMLSMDGLKWCSVCMCFCNFYDVVDDFLLCC